MAVKVLDLSLKNNSKIKFKISTMPVFIAKIKLLSGTENDYDRLSDELRKKSFRTPTDKESEKPVATDDVIIMSTNQPSLFEVTSSVSVAASLIGKKYSFTVRRLKD